MSHQTNFSLTPDERKRIDEAIDLLNLYFYNKYNIELLEKQGAPDVIMQSTYATRDSIQEKVDANPLCKVLYDRVHEHYLQYQQRTKALEQTTLFTTGERFMLEASKRLSPLKDEEFTSNSDKLIEMFLERATPEVIDIAHLLLKELFREFSNSNFPPHPQPIRVTRKDLE